MIQENLYKRAIHAKYDKMLLGILSNRWMNTNQIARLVTKKNKSRASWYIVKKALERAEKQGVAESVSDGITIVWRKTPKPLK